MAITSSDISGLPDYTDEQILKMYRWALLNGAAGQTRQFNGRSVSFPDAKTILDVIERLEARINANDGEHGGNIAVAQFGRPA